jgi:hypothetical protein
MALTRDFKLTVKARAQKDRRFCEAMLVEAVNELMSGDIDAGKAMLRDYINATISFETLSKNLHKNPKNLMLMLSPTGNPTCKSLFMILHVVQKLNSIHLKITENKTSPKL